MAESRLRASVPGTATTTTTAFLGSDQPRHGYGTFAAKTRVGADDELGAGTGPLRSGRPRCRRVGGDDDEAGGRHQDAACGDAAAPAAMRWSWAIGKAGTASLCAEHLRDQPACDTGGAAYCSDPACGNEPTVTRQEDVIVS